MSLFIELKHPEVLTNPGRRRALLGRINDLARNTRLLALCFAGRSEANRTWVKEHFGRMERYIRERERWVIAPTETTLADLRRDFYHLAEIYVTGDYGKFDWKEAAPEPEKPPFTWRQRIVAGLPRSLMIVFLLSAMLFLLWQPAYLQAVGLNADVIVLIFMGWLLLTIDALLGLGSATGAVDIAKGIKDLM